MTNEEKAQEIIGGGCNRQDCHECGGNLSVAEGCVEFRHLKEMAEWKEQQMIDKAVKWVKENYADFCREINYRDNLNECFDVQNFTEELRKEMKEQIMKTEKEKLVLNENAPKVIAAKIYCGWEILSLHIPNQYDKISNHYFYYYDVSGEECPVTEVEDYVVLES